jgi:hypothetical protein
MNLSSHGSYTIEVWTDWMQEVYRGDDTLRVMIFNQPIINTFPYLENFESGANHWYAKGDNISWELGTPSSLKINKAASGSKAWKTTLKGQYSDNELSYLYSPCFDISSLTTPYLSFSMALDIEQCQQAICDQAWIEYSSDGKTWIKLGAYGQGTNWYNRAGDNVWDSASFKRWHVASIPLPTGLNKLQLRFVFQSDAGVSREGVAVDDIHIYNNPNGIYQSSSLPVTQNVSGNSWIDFIQSGKLIASINPNNNNIGSTAVQSYVNVGGFAAVRDTNYQIYLDRNVTIKPTNTTHPDSTTIRIYFTDKEVDTLTRATGCNDCIKATDAYELGITKYDNSDDSKENGTLLDNVGGIYTYIQRSQVKKVPFDVGYYAEFKVKDFSEFWFNNGGANGNQPLPLHLLFFSATKVNKDVQVKWTTANEQNIDRYEIEVSKSSRDASQLKFSRIGIVSANNQIQNSYSFIDAEADKSGIRYYRIRIIDKNGGITYSEIRSVVFDGSSEWMIYPNPVKDRLQLISIHATAERVQLQLSNAAGQVVYQQSFTASGNQEKNFVPLQHLARGVYWLKILDTGATKVFKIIKE